MGRDRLPVKRRTSTPGRLYLFHSIDYDDVRNQRAVTPRAWGSASAPVAVERAVEKTLEKKGMKWARTTNPTPSVIWTAPIVESQRARVLDWSEPVGGNQEGNSLGRASIAEPKAANTMAL
jgi:hypothetical protein